MSFISYAQNYEDVMLWRALKHIQKGFYIDLGAAWPDQDSVTKAFYDRGWNGINVEPNPLHHALLVEKRPRDTNLQLAVAEYSGQMTMALIGNSGLSTLNPMIAAGHQVGNWGILNQVVSVDTLTSICLRYLLPGQEVHFLKVDVEGYELQALISNDWSKFRPWILLVEATVPTVQIESYDSWEPILSDANYVFVYADGLNRFYVACEHAELMTAFKYPPNIFDNILLISQIQAEAKVQQIQEQVIQAEVKVQQTQEQVIQAKTKIQQIQEQVIQAEAKVQEVQALAEQYVNQLNAVYKSRSWRMTFPLRWVISNLRGFCQTSLKARFQSFISRLLKKINQQLLFHPLIRRKILLASKKLGLYGTLNRLYGRAGGIDFTISATSQPKSVDDLSPRARRIYIDLMQSIDRHKKRGA